MPIWPEGRDARGGERVRVSVPGHRQQYKVGLCDGVHLMVPATWDAPNCAVDLVGLLLTPGRIRDPGMTVLAANPRLSGPVPPTAPSVRWLHFLNTMHCA